MSTTEQKRRKLLKLAKRRQADRLPPHACLADFHRDFYECDHVSPWSISAHNVDAEVMIIGQDWASSDSLEKKLDAVAEDRRRLGQRYSKPTNKNLREFLECMGLQFCQTYATNVFPFIKRGAEPIPRNHLVCCAKTYTLPEIEIVSPRMAICLGKDAFDAVCRASELRPPDWRRARPPGPYIRIGPVKTYGLPHPSPRGLNNAGGKDAVRRRWRLLGKHLRRMREQDN